MGYTEKELEEACANESAWESLLSVDENEPVIIHEDTESADTKSTTENDGFDWLFCENDDLIVRKRAKAR
jgi:hypothetical protein